MPRSLSTNLLDAITAQETGEVWLPLVKMSHDGWDDDIRYVPNHEAVTHDGEDYEPHGFQIVLPDDDAETIPVVRWVADAVDREVALKFRSATDAITVTVRWVLASQPEVVEIEYLDLQITAVEGDAHTVSGTVTVEPILDVL